MTRTFAALFSFEQELRTFLDTAYHGKGFAGRIVVHMAFAVYNAIHLRIPSLDNIEPVSTLFVRFLDGQFYGKIPVA